MNSTVSSTSGHYNFDSAVRLAATYTLPFTIALVLITNTLNGCVLSRRTLRSSSCTHYFLASVLGTFVYLVATPLNTLLNNGFGIIVYNSPFGCRVSPFITYSSPLFIALMFVCASIDRYCSSSSSAHLRKFSQVYVARIIIIIISIFTIIYIIPILIVFQWDSNAYLCRQSSTTSISVFLMSRIVLYYIVAPLALAIFGALTINNIRSQRNRVLPLGHENRHRRTERQLARMLIIQVGVYIVFSTPSGIAYVLITIVPSMNTPFFTSLRIVTILWQQATFFLSVFLYVYSGTVYRQELKKIFNLTCNRVHIL